MIAAHEATSQEALALLNVPNVQWAGSRHYVVRIHVIYALQEGSKGLEAKPHV